MIATAEQEPIEEKLKLALNKITIENYAKLNIQILEIYHSAETEEEQLMFIKIFFQTVCLDEKKSELYIYIIGFITREVAKSQNHGRLPEKFSLLRKEFGQKLRNESQKVCEQAFDEYHIDPSWDEDTVIDYE